MSTQAAIAQKFNVSQVTVSRALNGGTGVSEKLRKAIRREAARQGYTLDKNFGARVMRKRALGTEQHTNVICAILPGDMNDYSFTGRFLHGMSTAAPAIGCEVVLVTNHIGVEPMVVSRGQVDGVIRILGDIEVRLDRAHCSVPWVSVLWDIPEADLVTVDQDAAFAAIASHLWELGHRHIGYIGPDMSLSEARLAGLRDELARRGGSLPDEQVCIKRYGANPEDTRELLAKIRQQAPHVTAITTYNDFMAAAAIEALAEEGVDVPGELSITGFDGALPTLLTRTLTTAALPLEALGAEALQLLNRRLTSHDAPRRKLILDAELRIGDTTGPPRL